MLIVYDTETDEPSWNLAYVEIYHSLCYVAQSARAVAYTDCTSAEVKPTQRVTWISH